MRILYLIPTISHGGAETQVLVLARALKARGHHVTIACNFVTNQLSGLDGYPVPIQVIQNTQLRFACLLGNYNPYILFSILRLVRRLKPDIVQSCLPQMDILCGLLVRLTRFRWVLREPSCAQAYSGGKHRVRRWLGNAAQVVANSTGGQEYWASGSSAKSCVVIPNGIRLEPTMTQSRHLSENFKIVYIGRFEYYKNVGLFASAALELVRSRSDVEVLMYGWGPLWQQIRRLAVSHDVTGRLKINGPTTSVREVLSVADVFVSLSRFEGCPNSVLEAMVEGCPLVLSDISAHRALVDDTMARFVSMDDATGLVTAIGDLLDDYGTAEIRAARARARAGQFGIEVCADKYEQLYEEMLTRHS